MLHLNLSRENSDDSSEGEISQIIVAENNIFLMFYKVHKHLY